VSDNNVANAVFWDYGTSNISNGQNPDTAAALQHDFGNG
jgi:hypothetical protein